ncbi:MAG: hypothetical protein KKA73_18435 [Chloroflexi bacterium]|nr:hypothetical protein [Chloroflexota bacterium]MBU1749666.1 hypothetical protein [Chloroflexota bacterium]
MKWILLASLMILGMTAAGCTDDRIVADQTSVNQTQADATLAQAQAALGQAGVNEEYAAVLLAAIQGQTQITMQALNYQFAATMMPYVVLALVVLGIAIGGPLLLWVLLTSLNARYQHERASYHLSSGSTPDHLGAPAAPAYLVRPNQPQLARRGRNERD